MKLRRKSHTFVNGRKTDRECHACEEGTFYKQGHELVCGNCSYVPSTDEPSTEEDARNSFRRALDARVRGDVDDRPRLPGGWPDAYWGTGSYSFDPESSQFTL